MAFPHTAARTRPRTGLGDLVLAPMRAGGRVAAAATLMVGWLALLWAVEAVNALDGQRLDAYGITPRKGSELLDIVPAAFLHVGFSHLASNSVPLLVLGFIAALRGISRFLAVALTITVISGLGVWLVAPANSVTLGASGLIFGLFGYLVVRGFVDHRALDVVVGLLVGVLYGSILWGVLPTATGVSWQAHLFGLVGGVAAAFLFRDRSLAPGHCPPAAPPPPRGHGPAADGPQATSGTRQRRASRSARKCQGVHSFFTTILVPSSKEVRAYGHTAWRPRSPTSTPCVEVSQPPEW